MTEKNKEAREDAREPVLGRRVPLLDGRRIHIHTSGPPGARGEGPTVVFEAGHGETLLDWSRVMKELELREPPVRCVAYTRAGLGLSDASAAPDTLLTAFISFVQSWTARPTTLGDRSAGVVAHELQQLLRNLEVAGPVVVVAHGAGGEFATALATTLAANSAPQQGQQGQQGQSGASGLRVAGIVLVDPVAGGVSEEHSELSPEVASCLKGWRERSESNVLYAQVRGVMLQWPQTSGPPTPTNPIIPLLLVHVELRFDSLAPLFHSQTGFLRLRCSLGKRVVAQAQELYGADDVAVEAVEVSCRGPHRQAMVDEMRSSRGVEALPPHLPAVVVSHDDPYFFQALQGGGVDRETRDKMEDIWDQRQAELVRGAGVSAGGGCAESVKGNASASGGGGDSNARGHDGGGRGGGGGGDGVGGAQRRWGGFWRRRTTNIALAPTSSSHAEFPGGADKIAAMTCLHHRVKLKDGTTNMPLRYPQQIAHVVLAMVHEVEGRGEEEGGIRGLEAHPDFQCMP